MNWEGPYFPVDRHAKLLMIETDYKNVPAFARNLPGAPRNTVLYPRTNRYSSPPVLLPTDRASTTALRKVLTDPESFSNVCPSFLTIMK